MRADSFIMRCLRQRNFVIGLVLTIFGLCIVADAVYQHELNKLVS